MMLGLVACYWNSNGIVVIISVRGSNFLGWINFSKIRNI